MIKERLYAVQLKRFDAKKLQPEIEAIASGFANYLAEWRTSGGSRHALMGPVARVLDFARRGESNFGEIIGRALRAHEMAMPYLSPVARQNLEDSTRRMLLLIDQVPLTARRRILEQIEYHVFYLRRIDLLHRLEKISDAWRQYLEDKYKDISALRAAWKDTRYTDFSRLPFPSRRLAEQGSALGSDVKEFFEARKEAAADLEEMEEETAMAEEVAE